MSHANLTHRQLEVLRYICDYQMANDGVSPTLDEVADYLGVCKITVYEHVKELTKKSYIKREQKHASRNIVVLKHPSFQSRSLLERLAEHAGNTGAAALQREANRILKQFKPGVLAS